MVLSRPKVELLMGRTKNSIKSSVYKSRRNYYRSVLLGLNSVLLVLNSVLQVLNSVLKVLSKPKVELLMEKMENSIKNSVHKSRRNYYRSVLLGLNSVLQVRSSELAELISLMLAGLRRLLLGLNGTMVLSDKLVQPDKLDKLEQQLFNKTKR
jgi:hypothetical protein